jgi:hypothetical protein
MNDRIISIKQALQEMERLDERGRPVPFSIKYCTYNRAKKEGGELLDFEGVTLLRNHTGIPKPLKKENIVGPYRKNSPSGKRKILFPNGEIREVHIRLIIRFNNLLVRY